MFQELRPVIVHGLSLGATAVLHVAKEAAPPHPPDALILEKPPALRSMILGRYGWWNLWLLAAPVAWGVPDSANSLSTAPDVECPALFLAATRDKVSPPRYVRQVFDAYAGPKRLVEAPVGHNDAIGSREAPQLDAGLDWLRGQIRESD